MHMKSFVPHDNRKQNQTGNKHGYCLKKKAQQPFNPSKIHVISKRKLIKNVHKIILL